MINRDNCETYFLMYVDNELSATDKEIVDAFLQQNPDLQDELTTLQQAVLLPEPELIFNDKTALFKHIGNEISTTNYEEKFLLFIDDELPTKDKAEVETFVLQHPRLQADFTLLQQTKLTVELIAYPNKELLYKKEEKERRVVYLGWYKMAAAVAIGLITMLYFIAPNNKNKQAFFAKNSIKQSLQILAKTNVTKHVATQQIGKAKIEKIAPKYLVENTTQVVKNTKVIKPITTTITTPSTEVVTKNFKPSALENLVEPITIISKKNIDAVVTNNLPNRTISNNPENDIVDKPTAVASLTSNTAQQVVYKELDTSNDDKKSLLVGSIEINKDKLRGLLRKASTLFRNKKKIDDGKIAQPAMASNN